MTMGDLRVQGPADSGGEAAVLDAIWRIESAKGIAALTRIVRDVGLAEDLAQDAFVLALEQWSAQGIPDRPGAWLMGTAKHRAIDLVRRRAVAERKYALLARELEDEQQRSPEIGEPGFEDQVGDDLLSLIFTTCHPLLSTDARVALTLRLFGGLRTDEVARAFLVGEATIAQRIVRAKRTLAAAGVPFAAPSGPALIERLPGGAGRHLPGLQRGLRGHGGCRVTPRGSAAPPARTLCRPVSPPATRARLGPRTPTGSGSSRCTTRSRS